MKNRALPIATERELLEIASNIAIQVERLRTVTSRMPSRRVMIFSIERIRHAADELAAAADKEHRLRRMRENYIGTEQFGEPAWDMLLAVFEDSIRGLPTRTSSAVIAAHAPYTTGLRYVDALVQEGLLVRSADGSDRRVTLLRLSDEALQAIGSYFMATLGYEP